MHWLVGDLQGCDGALERLMAAIGFSPSRDQLWLLGDLVGRGPDSLRTLRRVQAWGAQAVLGNHDLNLFAVAAGHRAAKPSDRLDTLLAAADRDALLDWMREQSLVRQVEGWLLVHAGLLPAWDSQTALQLGAEVDALLRRPAELSAFLPRMMGNTPDAWADSLQGDARLRLLINAFTRLRFVHADGRMDFQLKEGADAAPPGLCPWFDHPARASAGAPIAFGHWSTLGLLQRPDLLGLDTGCVWGGCLTAARIEAGACLEVVSVACEQAQRPG